MLRVIFYVDGFNFYFGLKSKKWRKYYWLDLVEFSLSFLKQEQELVEVNYFSAVQHDKGKHDRQDLFFSANKLNPKFNLYLGKFLQKNSICKSCNKTIRSFEEKQTDVHIATKMLRDVVLNRCDISVLISADSDLTPPIDAIRELKPDHKIFVYFPPDRFSFDLKNKANNVLHLERFEQRFKKSMLPDSILLANGYVLKAPDKWK